MQCSTCVIEQKSAIASGTPSFFVIFGVRPRKKVKECPSTCPTPLNASSGTAMGKLTQRLKEKDSGNGADDKKSKLLHGVARRWKALQRGAYYFRVPCPPLTHFLVVLKSWVPGYRLVFEVR